MTGKIKQAFLCFLACVLVSTPGCYRGRSSKKPPIHIIQDMDSQPRYDTQEFSEFFEDGSTMRMPVPGTVAMDRLFEDPSYYSGKDERDRYLKQNALPITMPLLQRGRDRYNVYCSPCHGGIGDGNGIIINRGYVPPPTFHQDRLRNIEDGYVYEVIAIGIRNMPGYAHQIPIEDRWAVVSYYRALQLSQNAALDDVPEELREQLYKK